ncbi:ArnT family glycosyltransferase [Roseivirga sp.]|uniref:ArnT family glycosyltransferase n=1 Tax=Roseivirga sp. TaxID=1964215 RepID=UPI003B8DE6A3
MRLVNYLFLGFLLGLMGFAMVWLTMNKHAFNYSMDVEISPYGHALSNTKIELDDKFSESGMGIILNGEYSIYGNWPAWPFLLQSSWYQALGRNDIYASRLWSAAIYGLNASLFFLLIYRIGKEIWVAVISTALFAMLPLHLSYGSLIFSDIWFVTFWLLALLTYQHNSLKYYWLFSLIILVGSLFFWFVIFLLPAPLIIYFFRKKRLKLKWILGIISLLVITIWLAQWVLVLQFPESYAIDSMRKHSFLGLFSNKKYYLIKLIKRAGTLLYELMPLMPILLFYDKWPELINQIKGKWREDRLCQVLTVLMLGYLLYIAAFTQWFAGHEQGVGMFSILIASSAALLLSEMKPYLKKRPFLLRSGLSIGLSLTLFFCLNLVQSREEAVEVQDEQISAFVNNAKDGSDRRVCLFFDVPRYVRLHLRIGKFAIRKYTNGYTFNIDEMPEQSNITEVLGYGVNQLYENGIENFDGQTVFLISDKPHNLDEVSVIKSTIVNQLYVYQIGL